MKHEMELLSPAGDFDSLKAAVQSGADAVYFGLQGFNARRFANNFNDIGEAVSYTLLRGCKSYLTLNTLVLDREFPDWAKAAEKAAQAGISAFIVQDIGGAAVLKQMFPGIPLHASTQMTTHNSKNTQVLEDLGFSRVVLARELGANQIKEIAGNTTLAIEVFCHGALCVCYSGQCLMSSMLGGRSANRGACAQPCRLRYQINDGRDGYLLSTKDLCLIDEIHALREAGVHSIKIEGRMKNPEYVAAVTTVYRKALDGNSVTQQDRERLLLAFNRGGFTKGLFSGSPERLYQIQPDNLGLPLGTILAKHDGSIDIQTTRKLRDGDLVAAARPDAEKQKVLHADGEKNIQTVTIKKTKQFSKGMPVSLIADVEEARRFKDYIHKNDRKLPLFAACNIREGMPPVLTVTAPDGQSARTLGGVTAELAITQPLTKGSVRTQLNKTGNSPFYFEALDIDLQPGLSLPKSALNKLRRQSLDKLAAQIINSHTVKPSMSYAPLPCAPHEKSSSRLAAQVYTAEQAMAVLPYVDILYIPVDLELPIGQIPPRVELVGTFPQITTNTELQNLHPYTDRFGTLMVSGLMHCGKGMVADYPLNITNSHSLFVLRSLGYRRATLSTELNTAQLSSLAIPQGIQTELVVYGRSTLMVTQHCPFMCDGSHCHIAKDTVLRDRKGMSFPVIHTGPGCRVGILNSLPLYMADRLHTLLADVFRIMFTIEPPAQCKDIAKHYRTALKNGIIENNLVGEYTRGHYNRGV